MKKSWTIIICVLVLSVMFALTLKADPSTENVTIVDLTNRVRLLEQAVADLQQRCAQGSHQKHDAVVKTDPTWTCKVAGRKEVYYGAGETRGLAEKNAMEKCRRKSIDGLCTVGECSNN